MPIFLLVKRNEEISKFSLISYRNFPGYLGLNTISLFMTATLQGLRKSKSRNQRYDDG